MNFYNTQDFKCARCQHWFHPNHSKPYLLQCQHSVCSKCIGVKNSNRKTKIVCPYHQQQQPLNNLKVNSRVQEALLRLMKTSGQQYLERDIQDTEEIQTRLSLLIEQKEEDMVAFARLVDRIYTHQMNRIIQLKSRVRQQIVGHCQQFQEWKILKSTNQNQRQIIEQATLIEEKIKEFNELDLEKMAQIVIEGPQKILQRNFSIYDLIRKERKTLKSSVKPPQHKFSTSSFSAIPCKSEKQNFKYLNLNNTVESGCQHMVQNASSNILCKELSSFKLNQSQDQSIPQFTMKNSSSKLIEHLRLSNSAVEDLDSNSRITLRDTECRGSVKPKPAEKYHSKKSHFSELISSLKGDEQLIYSPEVSEEMLLSEAKPEINFLQECQIEKNNKKDGMEIRQRKIINCEKQNNKYVKKMGQLRTQQAALRTELSDNALYLFNYDLKDVDIKGFLDKFDWKQLEVIKLVGTGLEDNQFNHLLNYLLKTKVHSLLLPQNDLQEISLDAILNFSKISTQLKTVSLQRNNIPKSHANVKAKIGQLGKRGLTLYI